MTARDLFPQADARGFVDYRFHVAAVLCLFAATLFYEASDGSGVASLFLPLLTAFLLLATPAWRDRALGSAEGAAGLILHALILLALAAGLRASFHAGPEGAAGATPPFEAYAGYPVWSMRLALWMSETAGETLGWFFAPGVFSRFATAAIVALALAAIVAGRAAARMALAAALFLAAAAYLVRADIGGMLYFAGGATALLAACALLREEAARRDFWLLSLRRMEEGGRTPRVHNVLKLEILGELFGGRRAGMNDLRLMASRRLRCEPDDGKLNRILQAVLGEMVEKERLLTIRRTAFGKSVALERRTYDGGLFPARWKCTAQTAVLLALLAGYLLSPGDVLTDAAPVSGLLDDAAMLGLGGAALWRTWRDRFSSWYMR